MTSWPLVLTCEHAGNRVPAAYRPLYASRRARRALDSHRGYDPGALEVARWMARRLGAPLYVSAITRLLVEINRSPGHPHLFSEFSAGLDRAGRARVLEEYYEPHRRRVEAAVRSTIEKRGSVVHVGVHSFVPRLGRVARNADIGLLYDPGRARERDLCWRWRDGLRESSGLRVRLNYPYRGNADGFTTWLRRRLPARRYAGIELEINQACLVDVDARARARLLRLVADGLAAASS